MPKVEPETLKPEHERLKLTNEPVEPRMPIRVTIAREAAATTKAEAIKVEATATKNRSKSNPPTNRRVSLGISPIPILCELTVFTGDSKLPKK